jgi:hypothetical protein
VVFLDYFSEDDGIDDGIDDDRYDNVTVSPLFFT